MLGPWYGKIRAGCSIQPGSLRAEIAEELKNRAEGLQRKIDWLVSPTRPQIPNVRVDRKRGPQLRPNTKDRMTKGGRAEERTRGGSPLQLLKASGLKTF
jgi:hypothetical protein